MPEFSTDPAFKVGPDDSEFPINLNHSIATIYLGIQTIRPTPATQLSTAIAKVAILRVRLHKKKTNKKNNNNKKKD